VERPVIHQLNPALPNAHSVVLFSKADKKRTQLARESLKDHAEKVDKQERSHPVIVSAAPESPIKIGDKVKLKSGAVGEVESIKGKHAALLLGGLKSRVKLAELVKISSKDYKASTQERVQQISGIDLNEKMASFKPTLDIRGVRAEEAIGKVEYYIDEALLLGLTEVKILHGKGHGVLRELVRNVLKEYRKIISAKDEHIEQGGSGITVVTLEN